METGKPLSSEAVFFYASTHRKYAGGVFSILIKRLECDIV